MINHFKIYNNIIDYGFYLDNFSIVEDQLTDILFLNNKFNDRMYSVNEYINKEIYLIQYPKGELSISFGMIKSILRNKFIHTSEANLGSTGSPILDLNNKVIGMHIHFSLNFQPGPERDYNNIAIFLNKPIQNFIDKLYESVDNPKESIKKEIKKEKNFDRIKNKNIKLELIKRYILLDINDLYLSFKNNLSLPIFIKS